MRLVSDMGPSVRVRAGSSDPCSGVRVLVSAHICGLLIEEAMVHLL